MFMRLPFSMSKAYDSMLDLSTVIALKRHALLAQISMKEVANTEDRLISAILPRL